MLLITLFSDDYRYAFNGMEYDDEIQAGKNSYTTEFRQYDPRLGRWKSLDPLMKMFPSLSPYVGFDNNPVYYNDPYGLASEVVNGGPGDDKPVKGTTGTFNGRAVAWADENNPKYDNAWSIWFYIAGGQYADDNSTNGASYAEFLSWNPELDRDNGGTSAVDDLQMVYIEPPKKGIEGGTIKNLALEDLQAQRMQLLPSDRLGGGMVNTEASDRNVGKNFTWSSEDQEMFVNARTKPIKVNEPATENVAETAHDPFGGNIRPNVSQEHWGKHSGWSKAAEKYLDKSTRIVDEGETIFFRSEELSNAGIDSAFRIKTAKAVYKGSNRINTMGESDSLIIYFTNGTVKRERYEKP